MKKSTLLIPVLAAAPFVASAFAAPQDSRSGTADSSTCSTSDVAEASAPKMTIVETAVAAGDFHTLATALKSAGLVEALQGKGPFTVFAPTDAAFAALPEGTVESLLKPENRATLTSILTYHVVPAKVAAKDVVKLNNAASLNGQRFSIHVDKKTGVSVAGVQVTATDIMCKNGIIHVIDAVMMPETKNLVETAVTTDGFSTLVAAVKAAGLVDALQGEGPFTIFAPTNAAFAALPEGTLESLLKPENRAKLEAILKYHVVPGRVYSDQLQSGNVGTLQGANLEVRVADAGVSINQSAVTSANIENTNGVIHVIDQVLLPPSN